MGGALVTGNTAREVERATLDAFSTITRPHLRESNYIVPKVRLSDRISLRNSLLFSMIEYSQAMKNATPDIISKSFNISEETCVEYLNENPDREIFIKLANLLLNILVYAGWISLGSSELIGSTRKLQLLIKQVEEKKHILLFTDGESCKEYLKDNSNYKNVIQLTGDEVVDSILQSDSLTGILIDPSSYSIEIPKEAFHILQNFHSAFREANEIKSGKDLDKKQIFMLTNQQILNPKMEVRRGVLIDGCYDSEGNQWIVAFTSKLTAIHFLVVSPPEWLPYPEPLAIQGISLKSAGDVLSSYSEFKGYAVNPVVTGPETLDWISLFPHELH